MESGTVYRNLDDFVETLQFIACGENPFEKKEEALMKLKNSDMIVALSCTDRFQRLHKQARFVLDRALNQNHNFENVIDCIFKIDEWKKMGERERNRLAAEHSITGQSMQGTSGPNMAHSSALNDVDQNAACLPAAGFQRSGAVSDILLAPINQSFTGSDNINPNPPDDPQLPNAAFDTVSEPFFAPINQSYQNTPNQVPAQVESHNEYFVDDNSLNILGTPELRDGYGNRESALELFPTAANQQPISEDVPYDVFSDTWEPPVYNGLSVLNQQPVGMVPVNSNSQNGVQTTTNPVQDHDHASELFPTAPNQQSISEHVPYDVLSETWEPPVYNGLSGLNQQPVGVVPVNSNSQHEVQTTTHPVQNHDHVSELFPTAPNQQSISENVPYDVLSDTWEPPVYNGSSVLNQQPVEMVPVNSNSQHEVQTTTHSVGHASELSPTAPNQQSISEHVPYDVLSDTWEPPVYNGFSVLNQQPVGMVPVDSNSRHEVQTTTHPVRDHDQLALDDVQDSPEIIAVIPAATAENTRSFSNQTQKTNHNLNYPPSYQDKNQVQLTTAENSKQSRKRKNEVVRNQTAQNLQAPQIPVPQHYVLYPQPSEIAFRQRYNPFGLLPGERCSVSGRIIKCHCTNHSDDDSCKFFPSICRCPMHNGQTCDEFERLPEDVPRRRGRPRIHPRINVPPHGNGGVPPIQQPQE